MKKVFEGSRFAGYPCDRTEIKKTVSATLCFLLYARLAKGSWKELKYKNLTIAAESEEIINKPVLDCAFILLELWLQR